LTPHFASIWLGGAGKHSSNAFHPTRSRKRWPISTQGLDSPPEVAARFETEGVSLMNQVTIHPPEISGQDARFRWTVLPRTALYRDCQFFLRFPETVPVARIPMSLWWRVALITLHSHWNFLRPCTVRLPIQLPPGETEFWLRLLDAEATTVNAYCDIETAHRDMAIFHDGPPLEPDRLFPDSGSCATAFSGGKDSLLQAGLLRETTSRPLLVATTSPMATMHDHTTQRRRHVFGQIVRQGFSFVEVESDYRSQWDNAFARKLGYSVSINEICDTFLYFSALLVSAAATGATHLFVASENEVQQNALINGRVVQHPHFMYSTVTQRAFQSLLEPFGIRYSSLTSPLHSYQVQDLLWTRYPRLRRLQYSCWRVKTNESACNECSQCLRIAMGALAIGHNPSEMGIDLITLLRKTRDWSPHSLSEPVDKALPKDAVSSHLHAQLVRAIQATPPRRVARALALSQPRRFLSRSGFSALRGYQALRRRLARHPVGTKPGYRAGYLVQVDHLLRDRIAHIYASHFKQDDLASYADVLERGNALVTWITQPLRAGR
jgi:hypothetical protein